MNDSSNDAWRETTDATIAPTLHHVNLKTNRLDDLIEWYGAVIGTVPRFQFPGGAFLSNDDANHRIALIALPGLSDDPDKVTRTGMHHSAFEYDSLEDLLSTYVRLKEVGIVPGGCLDHGLTMSFYYHDPDGNSVELQADNFDDWSESTKFIETDPRFASDPIGVKVDPDVLVEERRNGVDAKTIHQRAYAGEYDEPTTFDLRLPLP